MLGSFRLLEERALAQTAYRNDVRISLRRTVRGTDGIRIYMIATDNLEGVPLTAPFFRSTSSEFLLASLKKCRDMFHKHD